MFKNDLQSKLIQFWSLHEKQQQQQQQQQKQENPII